MPGEFERMPLKAGFFFRLPNRRRQRAQDEREHDEHSASHRSERASKSE